MPAARRITRVHGFGLLACSFLLGNVASAADEPKLIDVVAKTREAIEANRAAAKSVELRGEWHSKGKILKQGKGVLPPKMQPPQPYEISGRFVYLAEESGERKRWEKSIEKNNSSIDFGTARMALKDGIVLDADDPKQGYLRTPRSMDYAQFDFYRDHWEYYNGDNGELAGGIDAFEKDLRAHPEFWSVKTSDDRTLELICEFEDDGYQFRRNVEVRPDWNHLPQRLTGYGDVDKIKAYGEGDVIEWTWKQEPESQVWYPATFKRRGWMIFPDGTVFQEGSTYEVTEVHFNRPIDAARFTFADLGLRPGARVYDMRVDPETAYRFRPSPESPKDVFDELIVTEGK